MLSVKLSSRSLQEGALSSAVAADDADLGALEKGERNALEDLVLTIGLPQVLELIDDLVGHIGERE